MRCKWCQAPIVWAVTNKGQRMPVNVDNASGKGNLLYSGYQRANGALIVSYAAEGKGDYMPHKSTCPHAAKLGRATAAKKRKRARRA